MSDLTIDDLFDEVPIIINPVAGADYKKFHREMEKRLGNDRFGYYITQAKGDATRIAGEKLALAEKAGKKLMLLAAGGDGMYNEVVNADADLSRMVFVPIPSGTSSDVARNLHLTNTGRTCNLLNKIFDGEEHLGDYVTGLDLINVSYDKGKQVRAINLFSVGFDGMLCKEVNESRKKGGFGKKNIFVTKAVELMKNKKYSPIHIGYIVNNGHEKADTIDNILLFTIITGRYAGSGMNYNPDSILNDGLVEGLLVKNMKLKPAMKLIGHVLFKKDNVHIRAKKDSKGFNRLGVNYLPGIESCLINILYEKAGQDYYFNVDGEHHRLEHPAAEIRIKVLPKATNSLYLYC
ncbi:hypothetical protein JXB28_05135 [Candidatus Woesearchaeota archaeon]|nr:hypothetical protein [Candidatus Woesearchaeota archaeon]